MKKQDKQKIVEDLKNRFSKASIAVLIKNTGLTVAEFTDFRKKLKTAKIDVKVAKNTLSKIAVKDTDYKILNDYYTGPAVTLWAYDDPAATAKMLSAYIKEQQKAGFIAASIKDKIISLAELNKLAVLPSRNELIARLLGSFKSPTSGFVNVLAGVPRNLLNVLNAVKDKKTN